MQGSIKITVSAVARHPDGLTDEQRRYLGLDIEQAEEQDR